MDHISCNKTFPEILLIVAYSNDALQEGSLYFFQKIYEIWLTIDSICDRPVHMCINVSLRIKFFYRKSLFEKRG